MIERPSRVWRREVAEQRAALEAGTLSSDGAYASRLWPAEFVEAVDGALAAFDGEAEGLGGATDETVWATVEHVVRGLNAVNEPWERIETGEREELCQYIDDVLTAFGVDVAALTARRGLGRHELTDHWRDW
jgi:hypothetical protein